MFTGIVQAVGTIVRAGSRLEVSVELCETVRVGDSVAVNGCCLTHLGGDNLAFDLSEETLKRTNLGALQGGDRVNLETAVRAGEPIGGHFVLGHVDAAGRFLGRREGETGTEFQFEAPDDGARFLADKGCITIDGVSLTVVEPQGGRFSVWIVPHTLENTNLGGLEPGGAVNLEYDLIARYLERLQQA
ncbi:MAG: riboflavin synthase [Armatimonadetes bacterium]|nr:riboflavin synthase [Armatimonadota bacterium]